MRPADPAGTLELVQRLRDRAGHGDTEPWPGRLALDPQSLALLVHLPPPREQPGWPSGYRYGLCHYRRGPGFVQVRDRRPGREPTAPMTVVLPDGPRLALFERYLAPAPVATGDPAFGWLAGRGLLLVVGGLALTLPYRLRRWPIPCTAV